jgi:arginine N-succinyltransferase
MSFRVRPAVPGDLESLYELAKLGGGGLTNLPADRTALSEKLARSALSFADETPKADDLFVLVMEDSTTGLLRGTAQILAKVGHAWPFYSYRLSTLTQHSRELGRTFRAEMLSLATDLEGSSEIAGLFLHPLERASGLGLLLARSRYLFIAMHRQRFAERIIAELRGISDERGGSPFWEGLAGRFFGMSFYDADRLNAIRGNQFIADLMPKHPIYTAMLPETARGAIGVPHPSGRAAMRMLEDEGFACEGYVDIFDGGPTLTARTDRVATIAAARQATVTEVDAPSGQLSLVATGRLAAFRCAYGIVAPSGNEVALDAIGAALLGVEVGAAVCWVAR